MVDLSLSILGTPLFEIPKIALRFAEKVDAFHLDIMDGSMTPITSYDSSIVSIMKPYTKTTLEIHLYVRDQLENLLGLNPDIQDIVVLHPNTFDEIISRDLKFISQLGVYILSDDSIQSLRAEILEMVNLVNIVTVNSLRGGQTIDWDLVKRVSIADHLREEGGYGFRISVDGGVNLETLDSILDYPIDQVVIGTAILKAAVPLEALDQVLGLLKQK